MTWDGVHPFECPTRVFDGWSASAQVGERLAELGVRRALVDSDPGVRAAGIVDTIADHIRRSEIVIAIYAETQPNPSVANVEAGFAAWREHDGGVSAMDAAKGVGILAGNGGSIANYTGSERVPNDLPPLSCLPTTRGAGSEVTFNDVITDSSRHVKLPYVSRRLAPKVALVDPELVTKAPPHVIAATGADALSQAIESYINKGADPLLDAISLGAINLGAIKLIGRSLVPAVRQRDREAVARMALASTMAGIAFNMNIVHAASTPVTAKHDVAHGVANAIFLPAGLAFCLPAVPERLRDIAAALGEDVSGLDATTAGERGIAAVRSLLASAGLPGSLREVGVDPMTMDIPSLVADALKILNIATTPRPIAPDDLEALYREVWGRPMGASTITGVKTQLVNCPIPEHLGVRSDAGLKLARQAAFVEITTADGLSGSGPCSFGSASLDLAAAASLLDHAIAPMLVGEDAGRIEYLWDKVYYGSITRVLGPRGIGVALLSGVDIALWDLKGKRYGAPLYELLGGKVHDPVPAYASSIYWLPPEEAARQARAYVDDGFRAVKMKVGLDYRNDIDSLAAIREAVGRGVDIMVDAHQCCSAHLALKVGRELERYDVLFFEEPLPTDDLEGHRLLAQRLDVRIATGENMDTRYDFLPYITQGALHVVQADVSRTGGISEARKINELAAAHHLHAAPHTFSDVLTVAASLHLVAATPNAVILELDRTYNPLQTELLRNPLRVHDGVVELPTGPGLGLEIEWDFVAAHPYHGEHGIGAGARSAFGLASEALPDRRAEALR